MTSSPSHRRLAAALATLAVLTAACDGSDGPSWFGGGGGEELPAELVGAVTLGAFGVAGEGPIVAVLSDPYAGAPTIWLYEQDAAKPDLLLAFSSRSELPVPSLPTGFAVQGGWVTAWGQGASGGAWIVYADLGGSGWMGSVTTAGHVDRAIALPGRVVAAGDGQIRVFDSATASVVQTVPSGPVSALAALGDRLFFFHDEGYGYLMVGGDTHGSVQDAGLARVQRVMVQDGKLHVGGPSRYAGHYRVARVAASGTQLTVEAVNEEIVDEDSPALNVLDVALDAATSGYTLLVERGSSGGAVARYAGGAEIAADGTFVLEDFVCATYCSPSLPGLPRIHAHGGRAYVVPAQGEQTALRIYRLP